MAAIGPLSYAGRGLTIGGGGLSMMMQKKRMLGLGAALAVMLLAVLTCRITYIPDPVLETYVNDAGETVAVEPLSTAEQYCLDHWEAKILPAVHERAAELSVFLKDVKADKDTAGAAYGNRANETSPWSFCVTGRARVLGLEYADKPNKTQLLLDAMPYDGEADCKLHFGKVFSSNIKNAIRDGAGFLKLDDFANQVEFADLTTAFNNKVKETIFAAWEPASLVGQEIVFYGCISLQEVTADSLVIIPVELKVEGA